MIEAHATVKTGTFKIAFVFIAVVPLQLAVGTGPAFVTYTFVAAYRVVTNSVVAKVFGEFTFVQVLETNNESSLIGK